MKTAGSNPRRPIATLCYILLWIILSFAFALMSQQGNVEMV